jgi:hypothetical protein
MNANDGLTIKTPLRVMSMATAYAAALSYLERRYPIKPDHIWAEVAGGVMISLVPLALDARRFERVEWRTYEDAVWRCFIAAGTPIILWQLGEAMWRHIELMRYTSNRYAADRASLSTESYADDTTTLAFGGGERTRGRDLRGRRGDSDVAAGAADA